MNLISDPDPKNITILILEDHVETLEEITETLDIENYRVLQAKTAEEFNSFIQTDVIDLFLIDLILPDADGLQLIKLVRKTSSAGIIIISGKTDVIDRVVGLEIGADDYMCKPFSPRELLARVRSVLGRTQGHVYSHRNSNSNSTRDSLRFLELTLDLRTHQLHSVKGHQIALTSAEYTLLKTFAENSNQVLSRDALCQKFHGRALFVNDRGIDGLVSRLRQKIELSDNKSALIKTIRGAGYLFTPEVIFS